MNKHWGIFLTSTPKAAAVKRSLFPFSAPVYVPQGCGNCPLRNDPEGIAKRRAATQWIHGLRFCFLGITAPLGWTSLVASTGNRLLCRAELLLPALKSMWDISRLAKVHGSLSQTVRAERFFDLNQQL
ncbi:hypothetical protein [Brevibacillus borstelensis]|uniref:hypothetical protein n=1 Tax=Brevibacillus borstelensis TaxID=45462 RepID=UPI0030F96B61